MRHPDDFNRTFGDWVAIMPHASADTVHSAINSLLARFAKKGGAETLALARMAENWVYSDSSEFHSEEIMLPFATAAANHKKIAKDDRAHFAAIEKILSASSVDATVPDLTVIRPDGSKARLSELCKGSVLLMFGKPDDPATSLSRIRFETDPNTKALIERGELTILNVYPGDATPEWAAKAADYPAEWHNVALPDADLYFRIKTFPQMYFLNSERKVLIKDLDTDYLLGAFRVTNERRRKK